MKINIVILLETHQQGIPVILTIILYTSVCGLNFRCTLALFSPSCSWVHDETTECKYCYAVL